MSDARNVTPTQPLPSASHDSSDDDMVMSSQGQLVSSTPGGPVLSSGTVTPIQPPSEAAQDGDPDKTPPFSPVMEGWNDNSFDEPDSTAEQPSQVAGPSTSRSALDQPTEEPLSPDLFEAASPDAGAADDQDDDGRASTVDMGEEDDRQSLVLDLEDSTPIPETQSPVFSYHESALRAEEASPAKRRKIIRRSEQTSQRASPPGRTKVFFFFLSFLV